MQTIVLIKCRKNEKICYFSIMYLSAYNFAHTTCVSIFSTTCVFLIQSWWSRLGEDLELSSAMHSEQTHISDELTNVFGVLKVLRFVLKVAKASKDTRHCGSSGRGSGGLRSAGGLSTRMA